MGKLRQSVTTRGRPGEGRRDSRSDVLFAQLSRVHDGASRGDPGSGSRTTATAVLRILGGPVMRGAAAAALQVEVGEAAAAALPGARSPLGGLGTALIDHTPGPLVDVTVALVEDKDKPLLRVGLFAAFATAGAAAGLAGNAGRRRRQPGGAAVLLAAGAVSTLAGASRPGTRRARTVIAHAAGAAAGFMALRLQRTTAPGARPWRAAGVLAGALAVAGTAVPTVRALASRRTPQVALPAPARPLPPPPDTPRFAVAGLPPLLTPVADFYITDVSFPAPRQDAGEWRLRVHGLVECELELSYREFLRLGLVELDTTMICVHNPVGGERIGTARWLGVPVRDLLELAGVRGGADHVLTRAVTGFTAGIPLGLATGAEPNSAGGLVAVGMNGAPLTPAHGFPARLVLPGIYGYSGNTKWLTELQLTTFEAAEGYWARRGWPRQPARVWPGSRIDVPKDRCWLPEGLVTIAGTAWAPPGGVSGVRMRINDGPWLDTELGPELAPTAWRQWRFDWQATPGRHWLQVCAEGRDGPQPTPMRRPIRPARPACTPSRSQSHPPPKSRASVPSRRAPSTVSSPRPEPVPALPRVASQRGEWHPDDGE
jgi:DMSO/TMAO reductase YedYZ molybdopterin-dependent catalytic subunit